MSAPIHISPSQIKTFKACPRKWAFEKIAGLRGPETENMRFGTAVHKHLEDYVNDGTPPPKTPEGRAALALIGKREADGEWWVPRPKDAGWIAEGEFEPWPVPGMRNVFMTGIIDVRKLFPRHLRITDYKTTSDKKWIPLTKNLFGEPQPLVYFIVCSARDKMPRGQVDFPYVVTKPNNRTGEREVKHLDRVVLRYSIGDPKFVEAKEKLFRIVARLADAHRVKQAIPEKWPLTKKLKVINDNFDFEISACGDYGGCPYRGRQCVTPKGAALKAALFAEGKRKMGVNSGLAKKLNAKKKRRSKKPKEEEEEIEEVVEEEEEDEEEYEEEEEDEEEYEEDEEDEEEEDEEDEEEEDDEDEEEDEGDHAKIQKALKAMNNKKGLNSGKSTRAKKTTSKKKTSKKKTSTKKSGGTKTTRAAPDKDDAAQRPPAKRRTKAEKEASVDHKRPGLELFIDCSTTYGPPVEMVTSILRPVFWPDGKHWSAEGELTEHYVDKKTRMLERLGAFLDAGKLDNQRVWIHSNSEEFTLCGAILMDAAVEVYK